MPDSERVASSGEEARGELLKKRLGWSGEEDWLLCPGQWMMAGGKGRRRRGRKVRELLLLWRGGGKLKVFIGKGGGGRLSSSSA